MQTQRLNTHGIGASEIAAIAGLNPYASPWDIWLRKTGQKPDVEATQAIEWGHRLEPAIRQAYADKTSAIIHVPETSIYHNDREWARATPDGIVLSGEPSNPISLWTHLVQCKNVGHWVEKSWSDAPPAYVQLQEQWEMDITGLARADVAVLIGGNDFRIYTVHRDDKMIGDLVAIADDFWRKVESRTPPKIDDSHACRDHFTKRLTKVDVVELVADVETEALIGEWRELATKQKATEKRIETIRNEMYQQLVDAKADRIMSNHGMPKLQRTGGGRSTNWRLIAELLGSTKCDPIEFTSLVQSNTTETAPSYSLYPPRLWAKEAI